MVSPQLDGIPKLMCMFYTVNSTISVGSICLCNIKRTKWKRWELNAGSPGEELHCNVWAMRLQPIKNKIWKKYYYSKPVLAIYREPNKYERLLTTRSTLTTINAIMGFRLIESLTVNHIDTCTYQHNWILLQWSNRGLVGTRTTTKSINYFRLTESCKISRKNHQVDENKKDDIEFEKSLSHAWKEKSIIHFLKVVLRNN